MTDMTRDHVLRHEVYVSLRGDSKVTTGELAPEARLSRLSAEVSCPEMTREYQQLVKNQLNGAWERFRNVLRKRVI